MSWNYRVIKDNNNYRVVEVFYDENGNIEGWSDCTDTILSWANYDDLKGTAEMVLYAFDKPVLVVEGEKLVISGESTRKQDQLHDLAEESTNGVFASPPNEDERNQSHDLVNDFIKKHKNSVT